MRIDSTYTSGYSSLYNILNKTQNVSTSDTKASTVNNSTVSIFSNESVGSISSSMNSEAMAMKMKLRLSSEDETSKTDGPRGPGGPGGPVGYRAVYEDAKLE